VIQTHLLASTALARAAAEVMLARKKGSIIFIGSMAGVLGIPEVSAYSAAKAVVMGLTRALAAEWSEHGIRVNAIVPGWIDTGMASQTLNQDPQRNAKILSRTLVHHLAEGDDVGWVAVYLCSPAAKFVNGTTLTIDGGASIGF
jgi:gluconate 5-dehydrogenase